MKNIPVFLIFVIASILPGKTYGLSIAPCMGFLYGQGEEIVYNSNWPSSSSQNKLLSQLLWDFKPLLFVGVDLEFDSADLWAGGFTAGISLKYGLPFQTGIMEDRDWLRISTPDLTHYSRHEAYSGFSTFAAELSLGYSWLITDWFWVKAAGDLSFLRFSWIGRNGYTQHGPNAPYHSDANIPWQPDWEKVPRPGPAIDYIQNWFIISPALTLGFLPAERVSVSLLSTLTPFNFGYCTDYHYTQSTEKKTYMDYPFWGISIKEELELKFRVDSRIEAGVSASFRQLKNTRGDSFVLGSGGFPNTYSGNIGGGGFRFFGSSAFLKFAF